MTPQTAVRFQTNTQQIIANQTYLSTDVVKPNAVTPRLITHIDVHLIGFSSNLYRFEENQTNLYRGKEPQEPGA